MRENIQNNMYPPGGLFLPEWRQGDGPAPYVWDTLPKGHRCAWSCHWLVSHPYNAKGAMRVTPLEWKHSSPDLMTDAQLLAEIRDELEGHGFRAMEAYRLISDFEDASSPRDHYRHLIEKFITQIRQQYQRKEFLAVAGGPADEAFQQMAAGVGLVIMKPSQRPGWDALYYRTSLLEEQ